MNVEVRRTIKEAISTVVQVWDDSSLDSDRDEGDQIEAVANKANRIC